MIDPKAIPRKKTLVTPKLPALIPESAIAADVAALNNLTYRGEPPGKANSKWTLRDIDDLMPHPRQSKHFANQPDVQFVEFMEGIRAKGMTDAIHILPDGIVISGHQRLRAARRLEWTHVPVIVRYDLVNASDEEVDLELIRANRDRRQLTVFEQAQLYVEVCRLKTQCGEKYSKCDLRDAYAARFSMSGRSLDRLVELVQLPDELQAAIAEKRLARQAAIDLAKLGEDAIQPVLQLLSEGAKPKAIRVAVVRLLSGRGKDVTLSDTQLAREWRNWLFKGADLSKLLERVRSVVLPGQRDRMHIVLDLVQEALDKIDRKDAAESGDEEQDAQDQDVGDDVQDAVDAEEAGGDDAQQDGDQSVDDGDPYDDEPPIPDEGQEAGDDDE